MMTLPQASGDNTLENSGILFVIATPLELKAVFNGLDASPPPLKEGEATQVRINGKDFFFLLCGVGPVNAAINLGLALGRLQERGLRPSGVLNLGIAGTFEQKALPIGGLVLAEQEIWPEYGLRETHGVDAKALKFPLGTTPEGPIWNSLDLNPKKNLPLLGLEVKKDSRHKLYKGVGITVAGVSAFPERAWKLKTTYSALFENMEGFALALASHKLNLPFAEIRAVSNQVGSRQPEQWDIPLALKSLGRVASDLLMRQAI